MNSIFGESAGDLSFEELYRTGYNMVLHKHGEKLYESVEGLLNSRTKDICVEIKTATEATFLEELKSKWLAHKRSLKMVRDILMYMDRTYVKQTPKMPVYDKGVNLFCRNCIQEPHVKKRLSDLLLELVEKERKGEKVDRDVIKNSTQMLMEMGKEVFHEVMSLPAYSHPRTPARPNFFFPLPLCFPSLFASFLFFPLKLSHFPMLHTGTWL
jgi:cullin 3